MSMVKKFKPIPRLRTAYVIESFLTSIKFKAATCYLVSLIVKCTMDLFTVYIIRVPINFDNDLQDYTDECSRHFEKMAEPG